MTPQTPATAEVMWEVVSQTPAQGQGPTGAYGPGHLVTARLVGTQTTFQVFIPNGDYNVETVRRRLAEKAATVAAIDNLKSHP